VRNESAEYMLTSYLNSNTNGAATQQPSGQLPPTEGSPIQRYVMVRATKSGWQYCSSYDQGTLYETAEEAQEHDTQLESEVKEGEGTRFPTIYSYTHVKTTSQMNNTTQGPHTVPHIITDEGYEKLKDPKEFSQLFKEIVPSPEEVKKILSSETKGSDKKRQDYQRYLFDYKSLYESIQTRISNDQNDYLIKCEIRRILELHPYATYAWKSKTQAGGRSLKGKGEKRGQDFDESVDNGGRWQDQGKYEEFLRQRKKLYSGGFGFIIPLDCPKEESTSEGESTSSKFNNAVARKRKTALASGDNQVGPSGSNTEEIEQQEGPSRSNTEVTKQTERKRKRKEEEVVSKEKKRKEVVRKEKKRKEKERKGKR
jgi:hypothetical protein